MKRFLPLLILTGLLFGQDVLLHKSGKNYKGIFLGKVDEKIIFKIEGEKSNSAFSINDVDIVITSRGGIKVELYYPFDTSTKKDNPSFGQDGLILKSGKVYNGTFIGKIDKLIVFQVEGKNHFTPFPILDVETIVTKSGEFTYPFDIPTKQEEDVSRILGYRPKSKIGQAIYGRFVLGMGVSCVMVLAILLALALGLPHPGM